MADREVLTYPEAIRLTMKTLGISKRNAVRLLRKSFASGELASFIEPRPGAPLEEIPPEAWRRVTQ